MAAAAGAEVKGEAVEWARAAAVEETAAAARVAVPADNAYVPIAEQAHRINRESLATQLNVPIVGRQ